MFVSAIVVAAGKGTRFGGAVAKQFLAVHDGARPLVTIDEIRLKIERAREIGAACLVAPVTDTIKEIDRNGSIVNTIDRTKLRRALTPQCFRRDLLERAFASFGFEDSATDESFLIERLGQTVATVEGSARNIKITVAEDLILAEALFEQSKVSSPKPKVENL